MTLLGIETARSEDYDLPDNVRSAIRYTMIEIAQQSSSEEDWIAVGEALIRAAERDDLSVQVSDRFVMHCPDDAFAALPTRNAAAARFTKWRMRANSFRH
jgi:hypothetical protein